MARPRYEAGQAHARQRIVEAFWTQLAATPFPRMSVLGLCRTAGLNKNTFYYHFRDLDDLAEAALAESLPREIAATLALLAREKAGDRLGKALADGGAGAEAGAELVALRPLARQVNDPATVSRLRRMGLVLSPNGAALRDRMLDLVVRVWVEELGLDDITVRQERLLRFLAGGLVGVLSRVPPEEYAHTVTGLLAEAPVQMSVHEVLGWRATG